MTLRRLFFALLLAGMLAASACGGAPTLDSDAAATAIAATVAAMLEPSPHVLPTVFEPTSTSEPTPAPVPPTLHLVYTDGGNLKLIAGPAAPLPLTSAGSVELVQISDDGQKIAYTRRPAGDLPVELRVVNADGSGDSPLMSPADFDALYPLGGALHNDLFQFDFLPGTHLLLLNTRSTFEGPGLAKRDDLIRIDTDTFARTLLLAPGTGGDFTASPDGRYLALVRPDAIEIRLSDGTASGSGVISYAPVITYSEYAYYAQPVWDAGSTAIAAAIPSPDPLAPATSGTIWHLPAGGAATALSTIPAQFFFFGTGSEPLISPDLARVAYTRPTTTANIWSLFHAAADASGEVLVNTGDLTWQGWSPDGLHFVYSLGGPMMLQLGTVGGTSAPLVGGTSLRWYSPTGFLFQSGSFGAWTMNWGGIGEPIVALSSPAGDFIAFDFAYR